MYTMPSASSRFHEVFYRWSSCTMPHHWNAVVIGRRGPLGCESSIVVRSHHNTRAYSKQRRSYSSATKPASDDAPPVSKSAARLGTNTSNINIHPDLSSHMRHIMRKVPHPVVVVTASVPTSASEPIESTFRGMTISSFNSVVLEPTPLVSFNVRIPSATYSAIASSDGPRTFLAHILSASVEGAKVGEAFAKGGNRGGEVFRELVASSIGKEGNLQIFAGEGTQGAPLLAGRGIMQTLRCKMLPGKEIDVSDHKVVVAEVLGILTAPGQSSGSQKEQMGLLYGDRGFRAPGPALDPSVPPADSSKPIVEDSSGDSAAIQRTMGLNVRRGDENM